MGWCIITRELRTLPLEGSQIIINVKVPKPQGRSGGRKGFKNLITNSSQFAFNLKSVIAAKRADHVAIF